MSELDVQVGGDHYKNMPIQPVEFCHRNGIGYLPGNVIKYVCRYKSKNGRQDLQKALHYLKLLIELEFGAEETPLVVAKYSWKEVSATASQPEPRLHTGWCALDTDHSGACRNLEGLTSAPAALEGQGSSLAQNVAQCSAAQHGHTPAQDPPSPLDRPLATEDVSPFRGGGKYLP